ncbi:hypothetical protein [Actinomadura chokoriensis]|uniref:WXG100 family type VII secretion target n=1 Tax=Actinomadura chokoriensis TaxID=454156 RepID=A0ABV4QYC0_9ACTN
MYDTPPRPLPVVDPARGVHGELPMPYAPLVMEFAEFHPAARVAEWLNALKARHPWNFHGETARQIAVMTQSLEELRGFLFRQADVLAGAWSDRASPLAQAKLQQIDATTGSLAAFGERVSGLEARVSRFLGESLVAMPSGDLSAGRHAAPHFSSVFHSITSHYRDVIGLYPRSWAFDLPFGGIEPPDASPSAPMLPPPGPAPAPGPPASRPPPVMPTGIYQPPANENPGTVPPVLG